MEKTESHHSEWPPEEGYQRFSKTLGKLKEAGFEITKIRTLQNRFPKKQLDGRDAYKYIMELVEMEKGRIKNNKPAVESINLKLEGRYGKVELSLHNRTAMPEFAVRELREVSVLERDYFQKSVLSLSFRPYAAQE